MIGAPVGTPGYEKRLLEITNAKPATPATPAKPATPATPATQHSFCLREKTKDTPEKKGSIFTNKAQAFFGRFGAQNAALVLAIAMGKTNLLSNVADLPTGSLTVANLIKNSLFSVIFYVIYATAFTALFVVLLARLIALWVMIALSPLMVLKYVLPQGAVSALGDTGELQKKFVKNAFIPIPVALILSIGFIMLEALQKPISAS